MQKWEITHLEISHTDLFNEHGVIPKFSLAKNPT